MDDAGKFNSRQGLGAALVIRTCPACGQDLPDADAGAWRGSSAGGSRSMQESFSAGHGGGGHGGLACLTPGSFGSSVWLLASMSLGVGVFVQPKVVASVGWLMGTILIVLFALITNYSQFLLLRVLEDLRAAEEEEGDDEERQGEGGSESAHGTACCIPSYGVLALRVLGRPGLVAGATATMLTCLIGNAAHLSTVSAMLHDLTSWYFTGSYSNANFPAGKRAVVIALLAAFALPFCFAEQIVALRHMSTVSVTTCTMLSLSMVVLALRQIAEHGVAADDQAVPAFVGSGGATAVLSGAGAICFTYSSVINLVNVYGEMNQQTLRQGVRAVSAATGLCCLIYTSVALLCVLAWGVRCNSPSGNVLYLVSMSNYWVDFWCFALIVSITLLYPVINFPMVANAETVLLLLVTGHVPGTAACAERVQQLQCGQGAGARALRMRREIMSMAGVVLVVAIDAAVADLADLFGLCGSLGLGAISLVLPALMYLWNYNKDGRTRTSVHVLGSAVTLALGLTVTFGTTGVILHGLFV